jgi:putative inorganic carbon (HCO3(-)) transporter
VERKDVRYRFLVGISLAAFALDAVLVLALERHAALVATAVITVGLALLFTAMDLARRHRWLVPLLFWTALSIPIVKHLGRGDGLPAINADHLIVYPVDAVILIGLAWALVSLARRRAGPEAGKTDMAAAATQLFKPDFLTWAILALIATTAVSIYPAVFKAPAVFALLDGARIYAVYVLFRYVAARGAEPILAGLFVVAAGQGILCALELFAENNFGLWQEPGWANFSLPGQSGIWKEISVARCGGTFGPNVTAQFLQIVLPFGAVWFLTARKGAPGKRTKYLILVLLTTFALAATFSRGGWLGAGAAMTVLILIAFAKRKKLGAPAWSAATLVLLAALLLLPATAVFAWRNGTGDSLGTAPRLEEWSAAVEIIKDHPLLGVGKGNSVGITRLRQPWASRYPVHNVYLLYWAETGLVGLLSFVALLFASFWLAARALRNNTGSNAAFGAAALAAFAGLAVRMLVAMSFTHPLVNLTFIALTGAAAGAAANAARAQNARARRQRPAGRLALTEAPAENIYQTSPAPAREENRVGLGCANDYAPRRRDVDRSVYLRERRISGERDER